MLQVLARLADIISGAAAQTKPKRLAPLRQALSSAPAPPQGLTPFTLAALKAGTNRGTSVAVRAIVDATVADAVPLYYVVVDAEGTLAALSVFGLQEEAIRQSVTLHLLAPNVRELDVLWEGRHFTFRVVRVDHPQQVLIGGQMPIGRTSAPKLASTTKVN